MNKLLKFEFRRLLRSKAFYFCLAFTIVGIAILAATQKLLIKGLGADAGLGSTAFSMLKSIGTNYVLLAAIFVSVFITEDYTAETIKNIYSKGFPRASVFWSKYVSSLTGCLAFIVVGGALQFLIGLTAFGGLGKAGHNYFPALLTSILLLLTYHAIYFAIAISIRKTGGTVALCIIGPTGIELVLSLVDNLLKLDRFSFSDYWIPGRMAPLLNDDVAAKAVVSGLIVAAIFTAAALIISFFANEKKDC